MSTIKYISGLFFGLMVLNGTANAGDVYVVCNKGLNVPAADVRDVFVGDKQVEGGTKLIPFDNSNVQKDFLDKVIKVDSGKYASIWAKKGFRDGLNPPGVKSSDAEVIAAVKSTPGAIGYISKMSDDVKLIQKY